MRRPSHSRRALLSAAALTLALVGVPLGVLASHDFADVPNTNPFHADIGALAASGVTTGCGGGNYCPSAFVTREQMAAFMNRLGALAPGKVPVVNADRLDGLDSTDFVQGGTLVHAYGPTAWHAYAGSQPSIEYHPYRLGLFRGTAGDIELVLSPTVPVSEHGIPYALESMTVCAGGDPDAYVNTVSVTGYDSASPNAVEAFSAEDTTDHTAYGCHTLNVPSPTASGYVGVYLLATFAQVGFLDIHSTTFTWIPAP